MLLAPLLIKTIIYVIEKIGRLKRTDGMIDAEASDLIREWKGLIEE